MNPTLPLPPSDWSRGWASDMVRVAQAVVDDLGRQTSLSKVTMRELELQIIAAQVAIDILEMPAGVGYEVSTFVPTRQFSGNGTSATGSVGNVQVRTNGSTPASVSVSGVGGAGADTPISTLSAVLATLISDFKSKGTLG